MAAMDRAVKVGDRITTRHHGAGTVTQVYATVQFDGGQYYLVTVQLDTPFTWHRMEIARIEEMIAV